jgi:hypothetical protein
MTIHAEGDMIARQLIATQNVNLQTEKDLFVGIIQAEKDISLFAQKSSILDIEDGTIEGIHANGLITMESYQDMANLSFSNDSHLNLKLLKAGDISIHAQGH